MKLSAALEGIEGTVYIGDDSIYHLFVCLFIYKTVRGEP